MNAVSHGALRIMEKLHIEKNTSILLITHDLGVVAQLCDRVVVMYAGQVVEQGTIREILKDPQHPYTRGLIRSFPKLTENEQKLYSIPGTVPKITAGIVGCRFAPRCEFAFERCLQADPPLFTLEGRRLSRCFLHDVERGEDGDGQATVRSSSVKKIL